MNKITLAGAAVLTVALGVYAFTRFTCAHRGSADKDSNLTRTTIPI